MLDTKQFLNIPLELRLLNQWVLWRDEPENGKVPYDPKTGKMASHSDPSTWSSFDKAITVYLAGGYSGIGFVFSDNDPYTFIDLDDPEGNQVTLDRQIKIFKEFDSYSEISPSGRGLHIIIKGSVPQGRRRSCIEIYSSHRYATFTGNVHHDKPIEERQDKLTQLWEQMGSGPATYLYQGDQQEKHTDEEIIEQAGNASNGNKFQQLHTGQWSEIYPSQSEADLAYIDMVAFYTQNRNQIGRVFRTSQLGKRDKARRQDYINWMINKSFDRMLPQLDFDGFKIALDKKIADKLGSNIEVFPNVKSLAHIAAVSSNGKTTAFDAVNGGSIPPTASNDPMLPLEGGGGPKSPIEPPPGLMGEIANFLYQAAPRPVPEIALAGAIGLMAGLCGRAYNISGTGLNLYIIVLAKTGRGKEGVASGIDKLMNNIKLQVPTSGRFRGPGMINSGQALIKHLSRSSNCFVSILGEFGITIDRISAKDAISSDKMLYQMLLDLYNKSGHGQTLQASIYAQKEDNVDITDSPALSILGESTPKVFYDTLNEEMIAAGLLPRFLIIEYNGKRVDLNELHDQVQPPFTLIDKLSTLTANAEMVMHAKRVINVKSTEEAALILKTFDRYSTNIINQENNDAIEELWNRAHMKAMRLAALVAVGVNMYDPVIEVEHAQWAINLVQSDIRVLSSKFESGEVGVHSYEAQQLRDISNAIKQFITREWEYVGKYCQSANMKKLYEHKIVPYAYLNKKLISYASFRNDKIGSTNALKRAIQILIDSDSLREANKKEMADKYHTTQRSFVVSNPKLID